MSVFSIGSENDVRELVVDWMGERWTYDRIEPAIGRGSKTGTADLVYSTGSRRGFLEFKFLGSLRGEAPRRIGLKRDQADFLRRHGRLANQCGVVLGVGGCVNRIYFYNWTLASTLLEPLTPATLLELGRLIPDPETLHKLLGARR